MATRCSPGPSEEELREARVEAARRNPAWVELAEPVARPPFLVDAESDELLRVHRGEVFVPGSVSILATHVSLSFYVDRSGAVVFVEPVGSTYTETLERRARREREREQPTPTRIRHRGPRRPGIWSTTRSALVRGAEAELDRLDAEIIDRLRLQAEETRERMRRLGLDHLAERYQPQPLPRGLEIRSSRHPTDAEAEAYEARRRIELREAVAQREA